MPENGIISASSASAVAAPSDSAPNAVGVEQSSNGDTALSRARAAFVQQWRSSDGSGSFSRLDSMCKRHLDIISLSETELVWQDYNDRPPARPSNRHRIVELSDALVQTVESRLGIPMLTTFSISAGHMFFRYGITSCDYILAPH